MPKYAGFGYVIESPIELPELEVVSAATPSNWRIEVKPHRPAARTPLGSERVYDTVSVHSYVSGPSIGLAFDDTGTFEVRRAERVIEWQPGREVNEAAVRADLLGRVMALAAHADGALALHASAVSIDGCAIAFLGPKHAGKSTLALALARHGARLLADDTVVIRLDGLSRPWAAPGVQRVRLWPDSARALDVPVPAVAVAKPTIERLTSSALEHTAVPLAACYVLERQPAPAEPTVLRDRLSVVHAALACVRFAKLGALAGGAIGAQLLEQAAAIANAIPVFSAAVSPDLALVDRVVATFIAWHQASVEAAAGPTDR